jgi:hypothetical protein
VAAERERLIDMRVKGKITESEFDQRDAKLAVELRRLEALLPRPEPVIDPKIMAAAIAGLFTNSRTCRWKSSTRWRIEPLSPST